MMHTINQTVDFRVNQLFSLVLPLLSEKLKIEFDDDDK